MTRVRTLSGLAIATMLASASPAFAACAEFQAIGNGARIEYLPSEASGALDNFDIQVRRLIDGVDTIRFVLVDQNLRGSDLGIGTNGPAVYDVAWTDDSSRRIVVVGVEPPSPMVGALLKPSGKNGVVISRFRITIPGGQPAAAGLYVENLTIRFQCLDNAGTPLGPVEEQAAPIALRVTVPEYVSGYVGSSGQTRGAIDFGTVTAPGASLTRSINVSAISTLPFRIDVDTENGQKLVRQTGDTAGIGYSMRWGNTPLNDGDSLSCPASPWRPRNSAPFEVTLDGRSIARLPAGNYRDTVTLNIVARDTFAVTSCQVTSKSGTQ